VNILRGRYISDLLLYKGNLMLINVLKVVVASY
jgi:hypothetical protein